MSANSGRFIAQTEFYVRYAETDAMGIVHHASYVVWFEEGRSTYARARGGDYAEFERSGGDTRHICITHGGQIALIPEPWRSWAGS